MIYKRFSNRISSNKKGEIMVKFRTILILGLVSLLTLLSTSVLASGIKEGWTYNQNKYEELTGEKITNYKEAPMLKEKVASGELPPVEERLPKDPIIVIPWEEVGQYGGTLRYDSPDINTDLYLRHINSADLIDRPAEPNVYLKSGLISPNTPGILSHWEMGPEGKEFTFKIREGLKWSDGVPVTTEDVRYAVEDVFLNKEVNPIPPEWLRWGETTPEVKIIDQYTFKVIFDTPYGAFINDEFGRVFARSNWIRIMGPKHYLKQFHKKYSSWDKILPKMKELGYEKKEEWGNFYSEIGTGGTAGPLIGFPYPEELPTLDPYKAVKVTDKGDWTLERNPYYYMVDIEGNQLPYIDRLKRQYVSNEEIVNMDIIQGKTDLQSQYTKLSDYPLFKKNEEEGNYNAMLLKVWQDTMLMYFFNLAVDNEAFPTDVMQDVRFRRALSLALDREQIKESVFLGFGRSAQIGPDPGSPYYEEEFEAAYADYDPEKAKALLEEIGLTDDDGDGWREDDNGKELTLPFIYFRVSPASTPGAEMAKRYWEDIGIKVNVKKVSGNYYWQKSNANQVACSVWWGGGAALPSQHWLGFGPVDAPMWNSWLSSNGESGIEPPDWVKEIRELQKVILRTPDKDKRIEAGKKILSMHAEKVWLIGTVADTPVPFIYNKKLGNIGISKERDLAYTTPLEYAFQWYFKD